MSLGTNLKRLCEQHGTPATRQQFSEGVRAGKIRRIDVSLRDLAESFCGPNWATEIARYNATGRVTEASEGVDASAFSAITGQLLIDGVREKYQSAEFVGDNFVTVEKETHNLQAKIEPWLSDAVDAPQDPIQPGMDYEQTSFLPHYITVPPPEKRGGVIKVTMEMIFSDLTRQVYDSAGSVGRRTAIKREENILKVALGLTNNHNWNGTAYNTYQTATPWINVVSSNAIVDWTSFNAIEQLFNQMVDPTTGKPIDIEGTQILCMYPRRMTIQRVLTATNTRSGDYPTTDSVNQLTDSPSPLDKTYTVHASKFAYQLLIASGVSAANAADYVFVCDKRAFGYREVFPLRVVQAPTGNIWEFNQDIALAVKASEFGVAFSRDPRRAVKSYAA